MTTATNKELNGTVHPSDRRITGDCQPAFCGLQAVDGADETQRRKSASLAAVSVFAILFVAAIAGNWVLDIFGISIAAFRCGGGLVILLRFFGLILVAIGVQFMLAGAYDFFASAMAEQLASQSTR